ncbi:MAG: DUF1684 domain-containing protein [Woeseiaceae bacterium]|nr:DUF1684 domain-containing protein [Woeseiaceae bacterium]
MKLRYLLTGLLAAAALALAADVPDDYAAEIETWRADRLARLKAPDGYLNLAGLFWLEAGVYSFGGDAGNDLVFPGAADAEMGSFTVASDGSVRMTVRPGVDVRVNNEAVTRVLLPDDTEDEFLRATYGSLAWIVINREGKIGIRLHDLKSRALTELPPIPYYDIDPGLRVVATLKRFDEPRVLNVGTVVDGLPYNPVSPGVVEFEVGGMTHTLEAYESGERLFFVFGDRTSGRETYGAGRFVYAAKPGDDDRTVLDFNQSYNPPCVFNDFSTCPVASPRNRLKVRIEAGEKYDKSLYFGDSD